MSVRIDDIYEALKECYDPEIPISIVERAGIELVWDPPWNPDMMTGRGKEMLGRS